MPDWWIDETPPRRGDQEHSSDITFDFITANTITATKIQANAINFFPSTLIPGRERFKYAP